MVLPGPAPGSTQGVAAFLTEHVSFRQGHGLTPTLYTELVVTGQVGEGRGRFGRGRFSQRTVTEMGVIREGFLEERRLKTTV